MADIGIYLILNNIAGKIYIGSSSDLNKRIKTHFQKLNKNYHPNRFLQSAWNKCGKDAFEFIVILKCNNDVLLQKEQEFMDFYKSYDRDFGYNLSKLATKVDPDLIRDMWKDEFKRNDIIVKIKQQASSEEAKKKRSLATKRSHLDPDFKIKISKIFKRIRGTLEARNQQSIILKNRYSNPEERKKQSEKQLIAQNTETAKLKQMTSSKTAIRIKCIEKDEYYLSAREASRKNAITLSAVLKILNTDKQINGLRFISI